MSNLEQSHAMLLELTNCITAAGKEDAVIAWVRHWVASRKRITIDADRFGNLWLTLVPDTPSTNTVVFTAHMDHPAFIVTEVHAQAMPMRIKAAFHGGVLDDYFDGAQVAWRDATGQEHVGHVISFLPRDEKRWWGQDVEIEMYTPCDVRIGGVMHWHLPAPRITSSKLVTPICDNLVSVAAALQMLERLEAQADVLPQRVQVLLTRAEEVGFVGAIAVCQAELLPADARIVVLENSKAQSFAPLGAGPIVRVGDRSSVFDPKLTHELSQAAEQLAKEDPNWRWQRALMPGGTCEATAFHAFGYQAACICLPLENYHNMNEQTKRIDSECIDLADFSGMVDLLVALAKRKLAANASHPMQERMVKLLEQRKNILASD